MVKYWFYYTTSTVKFKSLYTTASFQSESSAICCLDSGCLRGCYGNTVRRVFFDMSRQLHTSRYSVGNTSESLVLFPGSPSRETLSAFPEFIAFPKFPRWWPKCCWFYWQFQQYSLHRSQLKLWINFSAKDIQIIGRFWWASYFKHHDRFDLLALYLVQSTEYNSDSLSLSVSALETVFFSLLVLPSNLVSKALFPAFVARCFLHFIC